MARAATPAINTPPTHMIHRFLRQKDFRPLTKPASEPANILAGFSRNILLFA
jgi:hypothetical protein